MELRAGELVLGLVPEIGGSVAFFRANGVDLMRPLSEQARMAKDVLGVAMFPMTPYANRIAGNAFLFEGRTWRFRANNPPDHFNVHGTGWRAAWEVEHRNPTEALLALNYDAPEEPYSYRATQHFVLTPDALSVTTSVTNRGKHAMPFGFGQHPWFERDKDVELAFEASHFWLEGPHGVATDVVTTPPELDFRDGRHLPATWRNNCYSRWRGRVEVRYPTRGFGLRITAEPIFCHLMLYADPDKPYFCIEPQTNAACAFNKLEQGGGDELGVIVLAPDETASGAIRFAPLRL